MHLQARSSGDERNKRMSFINSYLCGMFRYHDNWNAFAAKPHPETISVLSAEEIKVTLWRSILE